MFGLKIYTVHIKPELPHASEKPVFLREGFSFPAFLLTFLWTGYQRLWLPTLGILLVNTAIIMLSHKHMVNPASLGVLQLGVQVIVGFHANDWRRAKLTNQGYALADITTGESSLRAEQRYFERALAA